MFPIGIGVGVADGLARSALTAIKTQGGAGSNRGDGASFGNVLSDVMSSTSRAIGAAEHVGAEAILGKASAREVVEDLMRAEQSLQVALALRDKTIAALQEISRMAI